MSSSLASSIDQAAENHTSFKVVSRNAPAGRLFFIKGKDGTMNIKIQNSPVGYSPSALENFGVMVQVLQAEGKLPESGDILISQLKEM